jgi:hypothetical protein
MAALELCREKRFDVAAPADFWRPIQRRRAIEGANERGDCLNARPQ